MHKMKSVFSFWFLVFSRHDFNRASYLTTQRLACIERSEINNYQLTTIL